MFSVSDAQAILDPALREQIEKHPRAQDLLRAFLYPYDAPDHDFLFGDGIVSPLPRDSIADRIAGRTPVLAIGSNRAPVQLARKFSPPHHHENVPVTMAGWPIMMLCIPLISPAMARCLQLLPRHRARGCGWP
ncbi:hypothetical protein [Thalassospira alkalitolerans]|uniref:hypothetical protein n=1 Tax=Thalassospira alkalitolerans TaxID=1293890 RepID=UPI0030EED874|tara:strand:+ start:7284 stop:7682 length:399 start_codon:yes stop_codon:yes gene_type:complete